MSDLVHFVRRTFYNKQCSLINHHLLYTVGTRYYSKKIENQSGNHRLQSGYKKRTESNKQLGYRSDGKSSKIPPKRKSKFKIYDVLKTLENDDNNFENSENFETLRVSNESNDSFDGLMKRIGSSKKFMDIWKLLTSNNKIKDIKIYTKAISRCDELNIWDECLKIVNLTFKNNIKRDIYFYNCLFNSMANGDKIKNVYPLYLNKMINEDNIKPDIFTASILLKGIKNEYNSIEQTQIIIDNIINEYNLTMTEATYTALLSIYGNAGYYEESEKIFLELIDKNKKNPNQIKVHEAHFGALFKAFASSGRVNDILKYKTIAELEFDISLGKIQYISS